MTYEINADYDHKVFKNGNDMMLEMFFVNFFTRYENFENPLSKFYVIYSEYSFLYLSLQSLIILPYFT